MLRIQTVSFAVLLVSILAAGCTQGPQSPVPAATTGAPAEPAPVSSGDDSGAAPANRGLTEFGMDAPPEDGDWLLVRMSAEPPHLNPITSSDAYATQILLHVFDTLLDRDPVTLESTPWLAEAWEISEDKLHYTFHLRPGVMFSDGTPVTAEDVKFSFDKMMDPAVDAPHLRSYYVDVTNCEVLDERTVRFTCSKPYYRHLVMLGDISVLPRHVYEQGDFNNHPNNRAPVGSGAYVLESWDTGQQISLVRNEKFWGKNGGKWPHFAKKTFKLITDENAAFQVLERGDLDMMEIRAEDWVRRANTPEFEQRFNKFEYYAPQYTYIGWNLRKPQFADKRVRRALTMLLDRETVRETIYHGLAQTVTGNFMIGTAECNASIRPWPFDPFQAAALLDEAGWKDTNSDGIRDKDGTPFLFEILIINSSPAAEQICTIFKEELHRAGIEMSIRMLDWAGMLERTDKRDFDAMMMGWQMPPDPDPYQVWHSSQAEAGSNYVGFINPEADQLIEQARVTFDRQERIRLYHRFSEILHDEQPYTFMFCRKTLLAVDRRVHGVRIYPFGPDPREWFVPAAMQRYGK